MANPAQLPRPPRRPGTRPRVLVVGGGLAGLSLAAALLRRGITASLVERQPVWPSEGAGVTLHGNGVRALRQLGLGPALGRVAAPLPQWSFHDAQGELLCVTDLERLWGPVGPCLGVARGLLQEVLVQAAAGTRWALGVGVTDLQQDGTQVRVSFSDGRTESYDLVVGADGIYSTVRALAVSGHPPKYADTMAWRSVIAGRPAGVESLMVLLGEGRFFGLVPVGDGHTYGYAALGGKRMDDPLAGRLSRLRLRFAGFGGPVAHYLDALHGDAQLHSGPVERVDLERWHAGRVVLVGDAAHATPPHLGEGGSLAIEDALILAEELAGAATTDAALDAYEARRRPRVGWVAEQSMAAGQGWVLPAEQRDAELRERGDQILRERYAPLLADP